MLSVQGPFHGAAFVFLGSAMRTRVYVGGFNLFYGALKGTLFRWLDPVRLGALLFPADTR